jgi:hypothetical protein
MRRGREHQLLPRPGLVEWPDSQREKILRYLVQPIVENDYSQAHIPVGSTFGFLFVFKIDSSMLPVKTLIDLALRVPEACL